MKVLSCLALCLVLVACGQSSPTTAPSSSLDNYPGQWLVINYWAIWCKPCIKEIPELNRLHADYSHITVLGVNFDGATDAALGEQLSTLNIRFPMLSTDPAVQLNTTRPQVLPTTLIIDPNGKLITTLVGPQTAESILAATGL